MYAELHCKTNFTFLEGASRAEELVLTAQALGYRALAITDRNTLAGVVRAHAAAKDANFKILIGAEITPDDAAPLVTWVPDRAAYGRLSRLITEGRRHAPKGECQLSWENIATHAEGLLGGMVPDPQQDDTYHRQQLDKYRELLGDRCYLLAHLHRGIDDAAWLERLIRLSNKTGVPLVAAGDVHYHIAQRMALQNVLVAIREGTTVADAGEQIFANAQRHLRSTDELAIAFAQAPEALRHTLEIVDRVSFSLDELRYEYPEELAPDGKTPLQHLHQLTWHGAKQRYPQGIPEKVRGLLDHELELIEQLHYEAYFLTVWDLVRFARSREILCQGRGSAANSAVCFCLEVTAVDPATTDVLFERFVSRERDEAPDIDIDFEHERREEVLQYLYDKYGRERAGMTGVVITYRSRSAIRDVGKALGLSLDRVDALAKQVDGHNPDDDLAARCRRVGIDPESKIGRRLVFMVNELRGFPRHLSQHVGGMVMTQGPLCELVPIENAAMEGRTVIQWDKDDLDELGLLKVDCLSLGMLSAIRKCFAMLKQHHDREVTLATIPQDDIEVYDMICRADTMGVFQIESRAQMSMLPRLKPRCYYDLVIEVAIVRPGPIQGNMVHPYLRRRAGLEEVVYPSEAIREVLHKTMGVPIFQEQAMRLAVVAAGFTPGEADQLRRAMGAWRRPGVIDRFRRKLIDGMLEHDMTQEFAESVFHQIRGFGEYGFPESHAASFALLVYVSCWLKHHYPAAFTASVINSQPMGFYAPAQLVRDARDHGVEVRPIDVNRSDWDCTLEPSDCQGGQALRLGMRMLVRFAIRHAERIMSARESGEFRSIADFTDRTRSSRAVVSQLAEADALQSLGRDRRAALWEALGQEKKQLDQPLLAGLDSEDEAVVELPLLEPEEQVYADYQTSGLSLRAHPLSFQRERLDQLNVTPAGELVKRPHNHLVRVAGLVLLRQRPSTAKGVTFVTIEDETGVANLVVHQKTWQRFYAVARGAAAFLVHGRLERKDEVTHVVVQRLEDLSVRLRELKTKSRDFR